jgi:hypothetical protein
MRTELNFTRIRNNARATTKYYFYWCLYTGNNSYKALYFKKKLPPLQSSKSNKQYFYGFTVQLHVNLYSHIKINQETDSYSDSLCTYKTVKVVIHHPDLELYVDGIRIPATNVYYVTGDNIFNAIADGSGLFDQLFGPPQLQPQPQPSLQHYPQRHPQPPPQPSLQRHPQHQLQRHPQPTPHPLIQREPQPSHPPSLQSKNQPVYIGKTTEVTLGNFPKQNNQYSPYIDCYVTEETVLEKTFKIMACNFHDYYQNVLATFRCNFIAPEIVGNEISVFIDVSYAKEKLNGAYTLTIKVNDNNVFTDTFNRINNAYFRNTFTVTETIGPIANERMFNIQSTHTKNIFASPPEAVNKIVLTLKDKLENQSYIYESDIYNANPHISCLSHFYVPSKITSAFIATIKHKLHFLLKLILENNQQVYLVFNLTRNNHPYFVVQEQTASAGGKIAKVIIS